MDLKLTEEQVLIQDTGKRFAESELAPVAAQLDKGVHNDAGARKQFLSNIHKLAGLGFMGLNVNSTYGGTEAGVIAFSLAVTEIARACASTAVTMSVTNMVAEVIQSVASEEQKQHYIPKLCSGDYAAGGFCLSEAGAGSDPAGMQTRAVRDGQHWVLDGTKMWISSAEYAAVFVVWAVTDPDKPKGKGISCFLVEAGTPGLSIGKAEEKMGQRASSTNSITFESCRIPDNALMGKENDGFRIAVSELAGGRIGIGSLALGVGLAAIDYARQYTTEREQFGKTISSMQGPRWMMADVYTELEAARLLLMNAAFLKQQGKPFMKQAAMAKVYATEAANHACYVAQQLMGGIGYTGECPIERFARDVRVTSIYEGTSEVQREIIARELLREIK